MLKYLLVGAGGMLGAMARYGLCGWISGATEGRFPYGTLIVNMIGSFMIGFFLFLALERFTWNPELRIFIAFGILGGFTTFSTFSYETAQLMRDGVYLLAAINVFASIFVCLAATFAGMILAYKI